MFDGEGQPNISRGSNFSQGEGSNCVFLYKPDPAPPLDLRVASLTGFVHISSWPKDIA